MNLGTLAIIGILIFGIAYAPEQTRALALLVVGVLGVLWVKLKGLALLSGL